MEATSGPGGGGSMWSDGSTTLANVIRGLPMFDGMKPEDFNDWMKKLGVVVGVTRRDIMPLLKGMRRPDPSDTTFAAYERANEDLYAILFCLVELPAALTVHKHEDDTGLSGDGQAAFAELKANYNRVTDEDICVQGFSEDYKDIKMMVFRDPSFDVQQMQATMRNIFHDERNCPNRQRKGHRAKKTKPAGATKWCSVHNTTTHSDEECYNQGAKRPERTGKAFSACTHCVHCSTQSRDIHAKPTTTEIPKETEKTEKAEIDFSYDEDAFKGGFMYHATCSKGSGRTFTTTATGASALVDSGPSETMFDNRLISNEKANYEALPLGSYTAPSTRMREVYLLRDRTETTQALHAYNMQVAPEGYRIEVLRCDKGGGNTGEEMRNDCRESAIKLEFAATNTPQEIGVSERDGQTLAAVTRALLRDGDFPKHMWGELMMTAAYLTNRTPHAALGGATPYSKMYNTTPDLSRLRAIGAPAFVHHKRYKKKVRSLSFPLTVDDLPNLRSQISARSPQTDVVVHSSRMS
ncbi:unnamed protein product [Ectocarpus sp. CCAP 1310/34]|nr:unnamed protein product [Ectocarpus sp. CCAP 1310/34]